MKKFLLTILVCLSFVCAVNASTLKWDASTGEVDGYTVYYSDGIVETPWHKSTTMTEMNLDELNLTPGTYTFYVTAFNVMGESGSSNVVDYIIDSYTSSDDVKPVTITVPNAVGPVTIIIN